MKSSERRNHTEEYRRRMELELANTDEGQDRLGKAKDRLDTRTAEIGQQILEENAEAMQPEGELQPPTPRGSGIDGNQFSQSGMVNEEANGDDIADLFGDFDEAMEEEDASLPQAPGGQTMRNEGPQNDPGKHLRPRSPTVSYQSDGPQSTIDEQMLDSLNSVDRRIIAASLMGVDITEVFSPERVAQVARRYGLVAGTSFDLTNGWDFTLEDHKRKAWMKIREESPYLLIGSPPCTYFSMLQELNIAQHKDKPGWLEKHEMEKAKAVKHIEFCCSLYKYQLEQGRHFLHEHPWTAKSWNLDCIDKIMKHPAVGTTQTHMCRFLMTTHIEHRGGEVGLVKKPTGFMSSSPYVLTELDRKCLGGHEHIPLVGGRAAGAAIYPQELCEAISEESDDRKSKTSPE